MRQLVAVVSTYDTQFNVRHTAPHVHVSVHSNARMTVAFCCCRCIQRDQEEEQLALQEGEQLEDERGVSGAMAR